MHQVWSGTQYCIFYRHSGMIMLLIHRPCLNSTRSMVFHLVICWYCLESFEKNTPTWVTSPTILRFNWSEVFPGHWYFEDSTDGLICTVMERITFEYVRSRFVFFKEKRSPLFCHVVEEKSLFHCPFRFSLAARD